MTSLSTRENSGVEKDNCQEDMHLIQENLEMVRKEIEMTCARYGRRKEEVTLIAVSKTKPLEDLQEAYRAGIRDFGENKVQELMDKIPRMPGDVRWHMIGHLQRNKVKYLVGKVSLIHSVDSLPLAQEISREATKQNVETDILVQVNVAGEQSKFGTSLEEALTLVQHISLLPGLHIKGLMTIAPYTDQEEDNRTYFRFLRQLSVDIAQKNIDNVNMNVLSMGMTGDYRTAIQEGATCVRVGTGIFGSRN